MATRRNRRVSHISPDANKMVTRRSQWVSHTSPDPSKLATRHSRRVISHASTDASKRISVSDNSKPNGRAKSRKGQKEVTKSASCYSCYLLRNARHSAVRIFRFVRARMARTFCFISVKDSGKDDRDAAHHKFAPARDSHQSEAVEDCIAFMNSSSRKYE